jgi:hypothetical protein
MLRETIALLKPVIYVGWVVAAIRLAVEALTTDLNYVATASVYAAVFVLFLFAGFTGQLDALIWKRLPLAALVLGVACWLLPNTITYGIAQFQGWTHGRFAFDREHRDLQERFVAQGLTEDEAETKANAELGRTERTRSGPVADTTGGKIGTALALGGGTGLAGTLWSLGLGALLIGLPATARRRRAALYL